MNVSSSQSYSSSALLNSLSQQQTLSGALAALTADGDSSTDATSNPLPDLTTGASQAASSALQNASSYVQTSSAYLGSITDVLNQMSQLLQGSSGADATTSAAFAKLQSQLRSIIGGSTAEIGGTSDVSSPSATYNGSALFDSSSTGLSVPTGLPDLSTVSIPSTNLQQGALLALIGQNSSGAFTLGSSDPDAASTVTAALQQASDASDAMDQAQTRVDIASSAVDISSTNLASALAASPDASSASQFAAFSIFSQPDLALASSSPSAQSALSLLEAS